MRTASPTVAHLLAIWTLDPGLFATCGAAAVLYLWGTRRTRTRWPRLRSASFIAGLLVLLVALLSGIDAYADELLSVHVVQHLLLILIAPALLLWGAPVRLALSACDPGGRRAIGAVLRRRWVRALTRPPCGFALFTLVVLGTHLSGVYEAALHDQLVHAFEHAAYFWAGVLFLAPLLAADPLPHPPGAIARFSWLMGAMVVMFIPAGLFMFDEHVLYPFYLAPARALHRSALADQHSAGVIMSVDGGIVMAVIAITIAMQAMIAEERRQRRRDLYLHDGRDGERSDLPASVATPGELAGT